MRELTGSFASIVTPFTDDGLAVSEIRLARLVRSLAAQSVSGLVACTETGERSTLAVSERKTVVEIVVRESQGSLPILVDATADSTSGALDIAQHAARHGARGAIVEAPRIEGLTEREFEAHVRSIAQYAGVPVCVVDSRGLLSTEARERLALAPGSLFALPLAGAAGSVGGVRSDEFALAGLSASPVAGFGENCDRTRLERAMATYGRARTAKMACEECDVEVGGLRSPLLALGGDARAEIAAAFG